MNVITPFIIGFASGLAGWTLLEYIIHYPLGHLPKGKTKISSEHLHHHRDILYFSPLPLKLRGAVPILGGACLVFWFTMGAGYAIGTTLALALGWTTYEALHKAIHVRGPHSAYGRWAARHHLYHHFMRPDRNHGVTTPLWDVVFGTYQRVDCVLVRERELADIPWLAKAFAHPETAPAFFKDYAIRMPGDK